MAKPSIFSSKYQKKMRRRKKKITIGIIIIIIVSVIAIVLAKNNFSGVGKTLGNIMKSSSTKTTKQQSKSKTAVKKDKVVKKNNAVTKKVDTGNFVVTMPSGKQVKIIYDNTTTAKVIKSVDNNDSDLDYNINPSSSAVVLFQKSTQDVMLANSDGTSSNITNSSYVSGSGQTFDKNTILKSTPTYIWVQSPKFIDDSNIAYISQLPWFDKNDKYIWKYNVQGKTNINTNITGLNVQINNITANGLEIVTDDKTQYLKGDGSITN